MRFLPLPGEPTAGIQRIDVEGMIRQASTRVRVDHLVKTGKKYIHLLSRAIVDDLINRSVRTIVDKHRLATGPRTAGIEEESRTEFEELLLQYQQTTDATSAVEHSRRMIEQELPKESPPANDRTALAPSPGGVREIAILQKRMEKLLAHVATMEAALKTLSTAKTFSNQQVQNLLRELGLAQEDKNFEKKKEMLKIVLDTNQGIRQKARELAARGITLEAPEERAVFTDAAESLSDACSRSSV